MANEQNKQTQDTAFKNTENQASSGSVGSTEKPNQGLSNTSESTSNTGTQNASTALNAETAKDTAKEIYSQAKSTAGQAYGVATKKATEVLEEKKVGLAGGLTSVADSIRQVGDTLRENEEQAPIVGKAAEYGDTLAQQIEKVSGYFERNDVRTMVRDVETYARRNPAIFIGAAFAVGILAARFLKATPSNRIQSAGHPLKSEQSFNDNEHLFDKRSKTTGAGLTGTAVNPS